MTTTTGWTLGSARPRTRRRRCRTRRMDGSIERSVGGVHGRPLLAQTCGAEHARAREREQRPDHEPEECEKPHRQQQHLAFLVAYPQPHGTSLLMTCTVSVVPEVVAAIVMRCIPWSVVGHDGWNAATYAVGTGGAVQVQYSTPAIVDGGAARHREPGEGIGADGCAGHIRVLDAVLHQLARRAHDRISRGFLPLICRRRDRRDDPPRTAVR